MAHVSVKFRGGDKMLSDLERMRSKAVPFAVRDAVNSTAFEAQRIWRLEIRKAFTLRNQFTERSIQVVKAKSLKDPTATVGSITDYLDEQEEGGTVRGKGQHKAIPGAVAAGLPAGAKRTKQVMRSRWQARISPVKPPRATGSAKSRNLAAMAIARHQGKQYVLLERRNGGQAIYRVSGGQRRWDGEKFRFRKYKQALVWDFSRSSVRVPRQPTLQRSLDKLRPRLPHITEAALLNQLRRHRIAGY